MSDALVKTLFPADVHHWTGLHEELLRHMPCAGRLLDLGCGINAHLAAHRSRRREVWGTDFHAHAELQHAEWFRTLSPSGAIPFPDRHFNLVSSLMVLEHIAQPRRFFQEVARVLQPGGHFVGHTISGSHYVTWIRRLVGLLPHSFNQMLVRQLYGRACEDTFPAHYRLNQLGQLDRACRGADLVRVGVRRYADPGYFNFSAALRKAAVWTDWLLEHVGAGYGRLYLTVTLRKGAAEGALKSGASEPPQLKRIAA